MTDHEKNVERKSLILLVKPLCDTPTRTIVPYWLKVPPTPLPTSLFQGYKNSIINIEEDLDKNGNFGKDG